MKKNSVNDLPVYQESYRLAMTVFRISKSFPREERYSLTDKLRRASRSVCTNLGEANDGSVYLKQFLAKLTDADSEKTETLIWIDFAFHCKFIDQALRDSLYAGYENIGRVIGKMMRNPEAGRM